MRMPIRSLLAATTLSCTALPAVGPAQAFCGFYVAKADASLFNKASEVVVARKGEQTAVTMASDYQGDLKEFALVIPVPTVVSKDQIKVLESTLVDHLDAYSAPRLVEYFDPDPCLPANRDYRVWHFGAAVDEVEHGGALAADHAPPVLLIAGAQFGCFGMTPACV